jgi:hypothetical protein
MKTSILTVSLLLLLISLKLTESAEKQIAVINLYAIGISSTEDLTFTYRLRSELFKTNEFKVIERYKMVEILKEQGLQLSFKGNECYKS